MDEGRTCTLIAITSTTGWLDWVHGDLWLCPDGILRRSRGPKATLENAESKGMKELVHASHPPTRTFTDADCAAIATADKRNVWVTWDQVASARLASGPLSNALHLQLTDGRNLSLRWLRQEGPLDFLRSRLQDALGDRLQR